MISLRCSSLPIAAACPPSVVAPTVRIESSGKPADMGSAVHAYLSMRIDGEGSLPSVSGLAEEHGVDAEELGPACGQAWNAWLSIADAFPAPMVEVPLGPLVWDGQIQLTGTADVVSRPTLSLARLGDWKSGWSDGDHEMQVKGYALLLARKWIAEVEAVEAVVVNTRLGFQTVYRWSVAELESWWNRLTEGIVSGLETFRPSVSSCRWCRRAHECPARQQLVRASSEMVLSVNRGELTPDLAADLLERARLVGKAADDAVDLIRAEVAAAGGSMQLSDGRTLQLTPTRKRFIRTAEAWPILTEQCGAELVEAVTVSKTAADKIVRAKAGTKRVAKKAASEKLIADLEAADAFDEQTVERLEIVRPGARIESPVIIQEATS